MRSSTLMILGILGLAGMAWFLVGNDQGLSSLPVDPVPDVGRDSITPVTPTSLSNPVNAEGQAKTPPKRHALPQPRSREKAPVPAPAASLKVQVVGEEGGLPLVGVAILYLDTGRSSNPQAVVNLLKNGGGPVGAMKQFARTLITDELGQVTIPQPTDTGATLGVYEGKYRGSLYIYRGRTPPFRLTLTRSEHFSVQVVDTTGKARIGEAKSIAFTVAEGADHHGSTPNR